MTILLVLLQLLNAPPLFALYSQNSVIDQLPVYDRKEFYTSGGIQDFTDYAKYYWNSLEPADVLKTGCFEEINKENTERIRLYLEDFEEWVRITRGELQENYDFDKTNIAEGNYVCIRTEYDIDDRTAFWNYSVYYYDVSANMIYYFHNSF